MSVKEDSERKTRRARQKDDWFSMLASDLVSVQPMKAPTGEVFAIDYVYSEKQKEEKLNEGT